jgi:hypothetical protein
MTFNGVLEIDGKRQRIEASNIELRLSDDGGDAGRGDPLMGTQVTETFSISGDKLVTSGTVRSGGNTTTTTTTTDTDDGSSTTTTTTSDSNGSTTTIEIKK